MESTTARAKSKGSGASIAEMVANPILAERLAACATA
jgi:hypothetical protein